MAAVTGKGAIFDLDGVLVDSLVFHRESWRRLGEQAGFTMTDELFRDTFGMPNRQILPLLFDRPLSDEEVQDLSERKEALYRELVRGHIRPLPGVTELLEGLHTASFRIALGSSAPSANIEVILSSLGVAPCFDAIVSAEDVTRGKPDPEVFLKAAERIGVPPERCVVVEDAVVGVQAAKAAAMRCIAVTTTHPREKLAEADRVVETLEEVSTADFALLVCEPR